jgi:uncharacterized protein (DUF697 family)
MTIGPEQLAGASMRIRRKPVDRENPIQAITVHVAWLCIAEGTRRVEDAEQELFKTLDSLSIPVVVVITTALSDQGFRSTVRDMFHSASNVVRVNSEPYVMDEGVVIPVHGLTTLADLTMEVVPDGQKNAFAAAQRVKIDHKVTRSRIAVGVAATSAFGAGAIPIPFSDTLALVPIQVTMLATISAIFGLEVTTGFLTTLVSGAFGSVAGTMGGRAIVGALLKFVPGAGSVVGGAISGGIAGAITTAFGEAYIAVLRALFTENPDTIPSADEIAKAFKNKLGSGPITSS